MRKSEKSDDENGIGRIFRSTLRTTLRFLIKKLTISPPKSDRITNPNSEALPNAWNAQVNIAI